MDSIDTQLFVLLLIAVAVAASLGRALGRSRQYRSRSRRVALDSRPSGPLHAFEPASARPAPTRTCLNGSAFVIDGDTIVIDQTQVRLFGIDAPELDHPYGIRAKRALARLCKGQVVQAQIIEVDRHGRTVAHCFLRDGRDLSAEMVKAGLAIDWRKYSGGRYASLEGPGVRRKLWLADARQKGRMHVWERFAARQREQQNK